MLLDDAVAVPEPGSQLGSGLDCEEDELTLTKTSEGAEVIWSSDDCRAVSELDDIASVGDSAEAVATSELLKTSTDLVLVSSAALDDPTSGEVEPTLKLVPDSRVIGDETSKLEVSAEDADVVSAVVELTMSDDAVDDAAETLS